MPINEFRRPVVAAAAGAVLFSLGLREAVRRSAADLELARSRARQLGATRILAGVVLLAALRRKVVDGPGGWAFVAADAGSAAALIARVAHIRIAG